MKIKTKRLLILVDRAGKKIKLLNTYLQQTGLDSTVAKFSDLVFYINQGEVEVRVMGEDITNFSLVYFRRVGHKYNSTAGTLAICLDSLGIKYFDSRFREIGAGGDKFTSLTKLAAAKIPIPKSMFLRKEIVLENVQFVLSKLGSPVIAKEYVAQRNSAIYILRRKEDFDKLFEVEMHDHEAEFLFQKYLKIDQEYRLLVLGKKVAVVHTKAIRDYGNFKVVDNTPADNYAFLNPEKISKKIKKAGVKAAQTLNLEVAGVDVCLDDSGQIYVLEVNRGPGFLHDPAKSPELPELAKFFAREVKHV